MSRYELTREAIEHVCNHTNRFKNKERVRAICEMRMGGAKFEDIGREFNLSPSRCQDICQRLSNIYAYEVRMGKVKPKEETITLYDRIKAMPLEEMASFFAYLNQRNILETADRYICGKCKADHGGHCPIGDDDDCLYDLSDKDTIKLWLEGEGYGTIY
jgi:hypothetical protein